MSGSIASVWLSGDYFRSTPGNGHRQTARHVRNVPKNEPAHAGGAGGAVGGYVFGGNYLNEHR